MCIPRRYCKREIISPLLMCFERANVKPVELIEMLMTLSAFFFSFVSFLFFTIFVFGFSPVKL